MKKLVSAGVLIRVQGDRLKLRPSSNERPPVAKKGGAKTDRASERTPDRPKGTEGKIQFRAGGSAFVIIGNSRDIPSIQIAPEDTGVALPGDKVEVMIYPGVKGRNPGEQVGRISRVLERARDTIVGNLRRQGKSFMVAPDDPRFIYEIAVQDPSKSGLLPVPEAGDKVVVKLDEWKNREDYLTGKITERLGKTHEPRAELLGVYIKFSPRSGISRSGRERGERPP